MSGMYNEELKRKFIDYVSSSINTRESCVEVFKIFAPYEEEWGSDLCTRTAEELKPIVSSMVGVRSNGHRLRMSILRSYGKWCIDNNVDGATYGAITVNPDVLDKMRMQTVISPVHLQKFLDSIYSKESENTVDNIYRCFYWLAYGGCPEEYIPKITTDDVDFYNMVVKYNGKEYPIYREGIKAFKVCVDMYYFVHIHPNYVEDIKRLRCDGNILIRGIKSVPSEASIRAEISRRNRNALADKKTDLKLSYYRVWLSGVFYRTYQLELIGVEPDFMDLAAEFMNGKTYNLSSGRNTIAAKQRQIARDYLRDYDNWKMTFTG